MTAIWRLNTAMSSGLTRPPLSASARSPSRSDGRLIPSVAPSSASVGRISPGAELRFVGDDGKVLPQGEIGVAWNDPAIDAEKSAPRAPDAAAEQSVARQQLSLGWNPEADAALRVPGRVHQLDWDPACVHDVAAVVQREVGVGETGAALHPLGLGALHGVNPGMGWLFALCLGLQERRRAAVLAALPPIASTRGKCPAARWSESMMPRAVSGRSV